MPGCSQQPGCQRQPGKALIARIGRAIIRKLKDLCYVVASAIGNTKAFSPEVDTGSRQENTSRL